MEDLIFKITYMVLYVFAAVIRAPYAQRVKKNQIIKSKRKVIEILLIMFGLPMMLLPLFYVFSNWIDYFNLDLPVWLRIIGLAGFTAGVALYSWSHISLGINWSPMLEIRKNHKLITKGPYKYIRHPMYAGFFLWAIFQGILLPNSLIIIGSIASFSIIYFSRIKHEEQLMIGEFGQKYKRYMKTTGRIFPRLFFR